MARGSYIGYGTEHGAVIGSFIWPPDGKVTTPTGEEFPMCETRVNDPEVYVSIKPAAIKCNCGIQLRHSGRSTVINQAMES
jgi:hypothetical protein